MQRPFTQTDIRSVDVALLEQLFDEAPDVAFFIKDADGRYVVVNHSLVLRNGLQNKSQLLGRRPCDVCPGELGRIPSEQDATILRTGRALLNHLELHPYAPHRPVWCLTTKLPIRDERGKIIGIIGFSRDVRAPLDAHDIPAGLAAAMEHLENHLAETQTPAGLACRAKLSPSKFARVVKRIFGLTPRQLITHTRLAAASRLLLESNRSVADIAMTCGFYDHSAFTRAFHFATGLTPRQFRDRNGMRVGS